MFTKKMILERIGSRKVAIDFIEKSGKRQRFIDEWGRTPEEYFDEYSHKEPEIWVYVLDDLQIEY